MNISVIICTHNPREEFLVRALDALKAQTLSSTKWELLLVDNASNQRLESTWDLSWQPNARHIHEEQLGLTFARMRGINEASGELLVFVDDDNLLDMKYLTNVLAIAQDATWLGAWGGENNPEFIDGEPPAWARRYLPYLAVRPVPKARWCNFAGGDCSPYGAGMCVRAQVAKTYVEVCRSDSARLGLDRRGKNLASNGDTDLGFLTTTLGLGYGVFPTLKLKHLIPATRLTEAYLLKVIYDCHASYGIIQAIYDLPIPKVDGWVRRVLARLKMFFTLDPRQRRFEIAMREGTVAGSHLANIIVQAKSVTQRNTRLSTTVNQPS